MSLVLCPECKNEVSNQAAACPQCGFPLVPQSFEVEEPTLVRQPEVVVQRVTTVKKSFPNWVFVPIALGLVLVVFGFIWLAQNDESANRNQANTIVRDQSANLNARAVSATTETTALTTTQTTVPSQPPVASVPSSGGVYAPPVPPNGAAASTTSTTTTTTLPPITTSDVASAPVAVAPSKGVVSVKATIVNQLGAQKPVRQEKFYLLDEDLETILRRANITPADGDLPTSMGVALIDPSKRALLQKYLAAIKPHIIHSITTDQSGSAIFKDVKPDDYYLFGITKDGNSYAIWNQNVIVNAGENVLAINGNATPVTLDSVSEY